MRLLDVWVISILANFAESLSCGFRYAEPQVDEEESHSVRIVGGNVAEFGEYPWQVSIQRVDTTKSTASSFCGGSVITQSWVLSAAHCFEQIGVSTTVDSYLVVSNFVYTYHIDLHFDYLDFIEEDRHYYPKLHKLQRLIVHEEYDQFRVVNDIALIKVKPAFNFNLKGVVPVCLPTHNFEPEGQCYISGWGAVRWAAGKGSEALIGARVPAFNPEECNEIYGNFNKNFGNKSLRLGLTDSYAGSQMCAGALEGGVSTCQGDSGGPLACRGSNGIFYLYGITSFGFECGREMAPIVYTRVVYYLDWIKEHIGTFPPTYESSENISHRASIVKNRIFPEFQWPSLTEKQAFGCGNRRGVSLLLFLCFIIPIC